MWVSVCFYSRDTGIIPSLIMALFVKGLLTVITFGLRVPAGIFVPSMAVGACFGRIVGVLMLGVIEMVCVHY